MTSPAFDYEGRLTLLQEHMAEQDVDAAVLSVGPDLPYFTGYEAMPTERLTALVVARSGDPVLFVPDLEAPRVKPGPFEIRSWGELEDPVSLASGLVASPSKVAVGDHMWSVFLTRFLDHWTRAQWIPASEITTPLRVRKDDAEIELLRRAAHAIDRVMARIPSEVRFSGRSERDVARDLAELTVAEGHDRAEFTIVAAGSNGASPHHEPDSQVIEEGDLAVCDFGGRLDGYFSDSTRTFTVGEPSDIQREVHAVVAEANRAGREAVRPGVPCEDVDRAARKVISDAGYRENFIHRTGHGIGLEVHEHPYMVEGNGTLLETGMTFSIEPGIYLSGDFGVRIEDIVACTADGAESLNLADRGLAAVE